MSVKLRVELGDEEYIVEADSFNFSYTYTDECMQSLFEEKPKLESFGITVSGGIKLNKIENKPSD